jgi:hypothetical protein
MQKVSLLPLTYKTARAYIRAEPEHLDENFERLTDALKRLMAYISRNQVPQSYIGLGRAAADTLYSFALSDLIAKSIPETTVQRDELRKLAVIRFMFAFQQTVGPLTTHRWKRRAK